MNFEEYLLALQYISEEGYGRTARKGESVMDEQDRESRKALGVVDG